MAISDLTWSRGSVEISQPEAGAVVSAGSTAAAGAWIRTMACDEHLGTCSQNVSANCDRSGTCTPRESKPDSRRLLTLAASSWILGADMAAAVAGSR